MTDLLTTPEIHLIDGHPVTTSRAVAEFFGREHRDVTRKIKALDCSDDFRLRNFTQAYYDYAQPQGGTAKYRQYKITRDGFTFLAMGFTGKKAAEFKEAYIEAFNRLEQQAHQSPALSDQQLLRQRILVSIEGGKVQKHLLDDNQALFDVPKLAAKVRQLEELNIEMTEQLQDLKECYDLAWALVKEDGR